jgi:hypothetical protein
MNPWRLRATLVGQGGLQIARWGASANSSAIWWTPYYPIW